MHSKTQHPLVGEHLTVEIPESSLLLKEFLTFPLFLVILKLFFKRDIPPLHPSPPPASLANEKQQVLNFRLH